MTRRQPEQDLQESVMEFLKLCLLPPAFAFHIPNGGFRLKSEAGKLKRMGVVAGMPDVAILCGGGRVLFIELKAPRGGVLSDAQKDIHPKLYACGCQIAVCRTLWEVEIALDAAGVPTRIARAA